MRWTVGNGNYISIKEDPWFLRADCYKPLWVKEEFQGARVASLIDVSGGWKEEEIRANFIRADADAILDIPLGKRNLKGTIISSPDQKGRFSVKSAYHLAYNLSIADNVSPSDTSSSNSFWKKFWKVMWLLEKKFAHMRAILNPLPTQTNIIDRGVDANPLCFFCRKKPELVEHIFWLCKIAK